MKSSHLYFLLPVLALAIGFATHAARHGQDDPLSLEQASSVSARSDRQAELSRRAGEISSLTRGIRDEGGVEEWLRWLAYLENASPDDLPRFLESLPKNSASLDLIADRWIELDPDHCFQYLLSKFKDGEFGASVSDKDRSFSVQLFRKWAERDLEGAIASPDEVEEFPNLGPLRVSLAEKLSGKDVHRAILYAKEHHLFNGARIFNVGEGRLKKWIRESPSSAATLLFSISESSSQTRKFGFKELTAEWSKTDPAAALQFGLTAKTKLGQQFAEDVFTSWSERSFDQAADWLEVSASDADAEFFTPTLIATWSKSDPEAAFDWTQKSLGGRLLESSISRILIESVSAKSGKPGELLARIESPEASRAATIALAKHLWGSERRYSDTAEDAKKQRERLSWFDEVNDAEALNELVPYFVNAGLRENADLAADLIQSPRAQFLNRKSFGHLLGSLGHFEPERSLELVGQIPENFQLEISSGIFQSWMGESPEEAEKWFEKGEAHEDLGPYFARSALGRLRLDDEARGIQQLQKLKGFLRPLVRDELIKIQARIATHPEEFRDQGNAPNLQKLIDAISTSDE